MRKSENGPEGIGNTSVADETAFPFMHLAIGVGACYMVLGFGGMASETNTMHELPIVNASIGAAMVLGGLCSVIRRRLTR